MKERVLGNPFSFRMPGFVFLTHTQFRFQLFFSDCPFQFEKKCWETTAVARSVGSVQPAHTEKGSRELLPLIQMLLKVPRIVFILNVFSGRLGSARVGGV